MKCNFFILLLITVTSLSAQKLNNHLYDSIDRVLKTAYVLNDQSEHGKAIVIIDNVLEFLKDNPDNYLLSTAYRSLSFSYSGLKDKEKAFEYAFKSIELNEIIKDTSRIIIDYNDLGVTYRDFGDSAKAKELFIKAAMIADKYKNDYISVFPYYNIGDILMNFENKHKAAEPYFLKSLEYANKSKFDKNKRIYVDLYIALGSIYYKLKRYDESKKIFKKALDIAEKQKYFNSQLDYYKEKIKLYKEDRRYEDVFNLVKASLVIRDSIENRKEIALVKKIEAEYKVKKSKEKLNLIKKENAAKEMLFQRSQQYNVILIILSIMLLLAVYIAFRNNKKLKSAKDKAERLTKVKSAFYSEISHELRTPLYAVIELSSLLLKEKVTKTHKEYLESLKFSASHLISLVNNVLELNKVESGELKVNLLNTNLENLLINIINSLEYALLKSNNTISLSYDFTIPEQLTGDSLKLSQVMINLISNAIKFTRNGHIDVIVKKIGETQESVQLYFEVSDNGLGISEENQKKIFEDYYQDTYQTDQTFKGSGLGLAIVHRLLKVMGTQINLKSEINHGSKFFFELSFKELKKVKLIPSNTEKLKEKIKGLHLLIVDDNLINQLVTKKILESLAITFDVVNSGVEAIEITKNKTFDCVLMDLHMPEMDGYTASKHIRDFNNTIPIIAFTAADSEEIGSRIENSVMNACVYKPFYISDLVETLTEVLNK